MTEQHNGSARALLQHSKGGKKHRMQDLLLLGFFYMPDSTAKEVAFEHHGWVKEKYGNSPKRARDLCGKNLMYLEMVGNRTCRQSKADAHTYRITPRGIAHLEQKRLLQNSTVPAAKPQPSRQTGRASLAEAKAALL